jgi:hypothetical protein
MHNIQIAFKPCLIAYNNGFVSLASVIYGLAVSYALLPNRRTAAFNAAAAATAACAACASAAIAIIV